MWRRRGHRHIYPGERDLLQRPDSGTQITVADNIGVPPGTLVAPICVPSTNGTSGVISGVTTFATPASAIGFIGADAYDPQRANLNSLAFAAFGQTQAFTRFRSVDRGSPNVRNGHYAIWGYEHMIAMVDSTGAFTNQKAANFIAGLTGPRPSGVRCRPGRGRRGNHSHLRHVGPARHDCRPLSCTRRGHLQLRLRGGHHEDDAGELRRCTGTGTSTCTGGKSCHHGFCE